MSEDPKDQASPPDTPAAEPSSAIADAADPTAAPTSPAAPATPPADELTARLMELGVEDALIGKIKSDLGATTVADLSSLTEADLLGIGMKPIPTRKLVGALVPASASAEAVTLGTATYEDVLPSVMADDSLLKALRAGGVLKVDSSTVIAALRVALADRVGLFGIPAKLAEMMEGFADTNEEPVDAEFFKLRKQITRRSYAEIFEAIDGLDGAFVTDARRKQLLGRINTGLWPAVIGFNSQLKSWQESWLQGVANPMVMMMAFMGGGGVGALPPGMVQPPDTGVLRDAAEAVNDAVNKVFAATGVQIASALAYDAIKIKETLENPRLPAMIGAANRDQMLRQLGVAVSANYPRLEQNLTRFVLATMQVADQPAGDVELRYFGALFMLGSQIPWDQLGGITTSPGGPTRKGAGFLGDTDDPGDER